MYLRQIKRCPNLPITPWTIYIWIFSSFFSIWLAEGGKRKLPRCRDISKRGIKKKKSRYATTTSLKPWTFYACCPVYKACIKKEEAFPHMVTAVSWQMWKNDSICNNLRHFFPGYIYYTALLFITTAFSGDTVEEFVKSRQIKSFIQGSKFIWLSIIQELFSLSWCFHTVSSVAELE